MELFQFLLVALAVATMHVNARLLHAHLPLNNVSISKTNVLNDTGGLCAFDYRLHIRRLQYIKDSGASVNGVP